MKHSNTKTANFIARFYIGQSSKCFQVIFKVTSYSEAYALASAYADNNGTDLAFLFKSKIAF